MPFLSNIHTYQAPFVYSQEELLDHFLTVPVLKTKERLYRKAFEGARIQSRRSVLPDFSFEAVEKELYRSTDIPPIQERNRVFKEKSLPILTQLCNATLASSNLMPSKITHVITFSCTGLFAPGLEISMLKALGLSNHVERHAINFMGCYAGILAMRLAHQLASYQADANILVFGIELCTLHFNPSEDKDYVLGNTLFADGAVAFLVQTTRPQAICFETQHFYSYLAPNSENEMAWDLHQHSLLLKLSSYVPKVLKNGIPALKDAFKIKNIEQDSIFYWAIHPGGTSILEALQTGFDLEEHQLRWSYEVLKAYGNMSSVTIFYVLQAMVSTGLQDNKSVFCTAFGPGLSIETSFLMTHV